MAAHGHCGAGDGQDARARNIRAMGKLHEASPAFGVPEGLNDEEVQALSASRPRRLPWQR